MITVPLPAVQEEVTGVRTLRIARRSAFDRMWGQHATLLERTLAGYVVHVQVKPVQRHAIMTTNALAPALRISAPRRAALRTYTLAVTVLAVTVLAAAACGGGGRDSSAAPPASSAVEAPVVASGPPAALVQPDPVALAAKAPAEYTLLFETSKGEIEILVTRSLAPLGADRLYYLANNHFFDNSRFFRVVNGFVAQFGVSGIPAVDQVFDTLSFSDDPRKMSNTRGTLAYAKRGPNTRSTQMFINLDDNSEVLDPMQFAPLGRVVRGMEAADQLLSTYGDMPNQFGLILTRGNDYFRARFPELDSIVKVTVKP